MVKEGLTVQMPTYLTGDQIRTGDWVRVMSSRYGVWHHGIVRRLALVPGGIAVEIIHNTKGGGVAAAAWHDFADGNSVFLHRRPESSLHAAHIIERAEANIEKPYALFAQNCEHFASFAFTGEAESESIKTVGLMAVGLMAVALLTSDAR
ncbi:MAG TPA: lecithin retinol acyltransferase family protein [Paludibaculum sp.]|jgi:hypothetical protein